MEKSKKLLMFLALNSVAASFAGTEQLSAKYDKMYDSMIKNINSGKSNAGNYKLIEQTLKKRNKELKDLYLQGDYIVKPEYLEWQVFFSGFYNEHNKGDNTLENAQYYAMPQTVSGLNTIEPSLHNELLSSGLTDSEIEQVLMGNKSVYESLTPEQKVLTAQLYGTDNTDGKFKKYQSEQAPKVVDLGLSISIKDLNKNITGMGTTEITVPVISSSSMNFAIPTSLPIDPINIVTFNPSTPVISTINFNPIPVLSLNGTGGGNEGIDSTVVRNRQYRWKI